LTPGRVDAANRHAEPNFAYFVSQQKSTAYFTEHGYRACKIEHPGLDLLAVELMGAFPAAKFLSIVRPIEQIVRSHRSLPWGVQPDVAVKWWVQDLVILQFLNRRGRLFTVCLEDHEAFDTKAFCDFLGVPVGEPIQHWTKLWPKVNSSDSVVSGTTPASTPIASPTKDELITKYPIIPDIERQYLELLER
jgi:hypothetical protein